MKMEVRKVFFPVDLAGSSYRIASRVRSIADQLDAELHLVYVMEPLDGYSTFFVPHRSLDLMETEDMVLAERHLEEFAEKYFQDRPRVIRAVLRGNPVEQIRKYAESEKIDMVIVATHDRFPLEQAIFGNIAEQIARDSPVPVTVINPSIGEKKAHMPVGSQVAQKRLFDFPETMPFT
jgi:nucleotide-binding universal stress UspA family protein